MAVVGVQVVAVGGDFISTNFLRRREEVRHGGGNRRGHRNEARCREGLHQPHTRGLEERLVDPELVPFAQLHVVVIVVRAVSAQRYLAGERHRVGPVKGELVGACPREGDDCSGVALLLGVGYQDVPDVLLLFGDVIEAPVGLVGPAGYGNRGRGGFANNGGILPYFGIVHTVLLLEEDTRIDDLQRLLWNGVVCGELCLIE